MSYSLVYSFDLMWLDGIYMLPIILLGVEKLLSQGKFHLLSLALLYTFVTNFYISYMIGIFTFLYFVTRFFSLNSSITKRLFLTKFLKFVVATFLGAGGAAFILIPTFFVIKSSANKAKEIPFSFEFSFSGIDLYGKLYNGMYDSLVNGLPNVYVGLLSLLIFPLFFILKRIAFREKLLTVFLLLILFISFQVPVLNLAWHGFEEPTWFPYRFSFLFSFVLIYMAVIVFKHFESYLLKPLFLIYLFNIFMLFLIEKITPENIDGKSVAENFLFLTIFTILIMAKFKTKDYQIFFNVLITIFVLLDLSLNSWKMLHELDKQFSYQTRSEFDRLGNDYGQIITQIHEEDTEFFRMESLVNRTFNDPLRYGFKGVTHFSSLSNENLLKYLSSLGFTTNNYWIGYHGSTLLTDSMINLKYVISPGDLNRFGYEKVSTQGKYTIYRNNNVLPLGFLLSSDQINYPVSSNPFSNQNHLIGETLFNPLKKSDITSENATLQQINNKLVIKKIDKNKEGYLKYYFSIKEPSQLYMNLKMNPLRSSTILVNGKSLGSYPTTYNNNIFDLGLFEDQQTVEVTLKLPNDEMILEDQLFYALNLEKYKDWIDSFHNKNSLTKITWTNRSIEGMINANKKGTLFTSIPFDKGWTASVDGEKVDIKKVQNAFIGVSLEKGRQHIEFTYTPPGLVVGSIISIISLLLLVISYFFPFKKRLKHPDTLGNH